MSLLPSSFLADWGPGWSMQRGQVKSMAGQCQYTRAAGQPRVASFWRGRDAADCADRAGSMGGCAGNRQGLTAAIAAVSGDLNIAAEPAENTKDSGLPAGATGLCMVAWRLLLFWREFSLGDAS